MNRLTRLVKPATPGQKKVSKATGAQRATDVARVKAGAAGALTAAALSGMSITELRKAKREAETEAQRAKIQAAIEKTLRKMEQEKQTMKGNNTRGTSPKPRLRPQEKAKGGAVKKTKMKSGGYAKKNK